MLRITITLQIIVLLLLSCSKEEKLVPVTQLPEDITQLYIEKGNTNASQVILYANGGPSSTLEIGYFDDLNFSEFHEVYVHQSNTYNPEVIIGLNENLTFERAIREDQVSVEIMHRVARHFKSQGKEVYIVGHSFGAILIASLIANKEPIATRYLIMAGRLNMPDVVWQGFRDRQVYNFEGGTTPTARALPSTISEREKKELYAIARLQAGFAQNRYTELLQNKSLKNVIYVFGEKDEAVGRLTNEEVDFLNNKNATIYKIQNGSHGSMTSSPHKEKLKGLLLD